MRNVQKWKPTKFIDSRRGWRSGTKLAPTSRMVADLQAVAYADMLERYARGLLFDVGCGAVPLYRAYRDIVENVFCIDWPGSAYQTKHVDIFADLSKGIPVNNSSADTVLLTDVIEHVPNPHVLIQETARILRPGGYALIGVPFFYWIHEEPLDYFRPTQYALESLCKCAGLRVVEIRAYGGAPEVLVDIAGKLAALAVPAAATLLGSLQRFVVTLLHAAAPSRRLCQGSARRFPLGHVLVACKDRP